MTLEQFKSWALALGQVGNPNPNNTYLGQCVSLIQQYLYQVYAIAWTPRGDAKDWPTNPDVLSHFDRVSSPQAGDIGVVGPEYGNGRGHIFIYLTPNTILEQNGRVPLRVTTGSAYSNPIAILRSKAGEIDMEKLHETNKRLDKAEAELAKIYKILDESNKDKDRLWKALDTIKNALQKLIDQLFASLNSTDKRVDKLEKK